MVESNFSLQELKSVLRNVPEIVEVVGSAYTNQLLHINDYEEEKVKSVLQSVFTQLMLVGKNDIFEVTSKLKNRLLMESQVSRYYEK